MSDDSSAGHPEQQSDSTFGSSIDVYFNLNPDKFSTMPTGEFLQQAREYLDASDAYERAKQTLLELDERKKQLEDVAREGEATEEQPAEPADEEQPATEEHHDDPLEQAIEHAEERPAESAVEEQPAADPPAEHDDSQNNDHPQISRAEVDLGGGPAL